MWFDKEELQRLEGVYLASRNPGDLGPLYVELKKAGRVLLSAYLKKKGLRFGLTRRSIIIEDATTRLLEMYLKHPDQRSIPLAARMHLEIVFQLHNKKQIRADLEGDIPDGFVAHPKADLKHQDFYLARVAGDRRVNGRKIVVDLYRHRYYRVAILAIAKYTSETWIRQHSVELHTIFLMTRG